MTTATERNLHSGPANPSPGLETCIPTVEGYPSLKSGRLTRSQAEAILKELNKCA